MSVGYFRKTKILIFMVYVFYNPILFSVFLKRNCHRCDCAYPFLKIYHLEILFFAFFFPKILTAT